MHCYYVKLGGETISVGTWPCSHNTLLKARLAFSYLQGVGQICSYIKHKEKSFPLVEDTTDAMESSVY